MVRDEGKPVALIGAQWGIGALGRPQYGSETLAQYISLCVSIQDDQFRL
jgi:hypothetical protein